MFRYVGVGIHVALRLKRDMTKPIEIRDTQLLAFDSLESTLDASLFQAGFEAGMRNAFGKSQVAPYLHEEAHWEMGFQTGLECALTAMVRYKEMVG